MSISFLFKPFPCHDLRLERLNIDFLIVVSCNEIVVTIADYNYVNNSSVGGTIVSTIVTTSVGILAGRIIWDEVTKVRHF